MAVAVSVTLSQRDLMGKEFFQDFFFYKQKEISDYVRFFSRKILFNKRKSERIRFGIFLVPSKCAFFFTRNLFYLFSPPQKIAIKMVHNSSREIHREMDCQIFCIPNQSQE